MHRRVVALCLLALLFAGCGERPNSPPPGTSTTSASPEPMPDTAVFDAHAARPGPMAGLVAVRLARRDGADRLVLEFADRVPGYNIVYRPLPARADGSGAVIPLLGADSFVQISLNPATGKGWGGALRTYAGPSTVTADTAAVTEATAAGDFEAVLTWVVGMRRKKPFRVTVLDEPARLVVDFQT